jgi:hypothetical protein
LILCLDGLTLFAHALDRLSFRPDTAAVLDPTILELANWLEATVSDVTASETPVPADEILQFAKYRALLYAEATSLLGTSAYDKHTVIWLAARKYCQGPGLSHGCPTDEAYSSAIDPRTG